ncbi:MAG: AMP-binding protein [Desulfobacteraceae bacterium]|nr:AMP-binding protein [Desulfobacteraceae bacterium]
MDYLRNLTFFDIYEKNALYNGMDIAIHWNGQDTTFSDLYKDTSKLARGLQDLDLPSGSRIAVLSQNHPAFFHLFGAAAALNLCLVLINRRLSDEEIRYIIEDTTPSLIVADKEMATIANNLTNEITCLKNCYVIDSKDPADDFSNLYHKELLSSPVTGCLDDPYIIIHTAAVQGKPRGAVLGQANIMLSNQQIIETFDIDNTKAYLNILPLFHIMGVNLGLGTIQAAGKNVVMDKFNPSLTCELIQSQKINIIGSFPPILINLIEAYEKESFDLSSVKVAAGLEQPDTVQKWEKITQSTFWTMYGQTETSGLITFTPYFKRAGSAGKISSLANIKIVDDFDNILPADETGEIVVRGPLVFQGYWNADNLNAHTFRNGWHHTGDLGMIDTDGFLFFKGRKSEKELIKPGGENVFPAEVENAIIQHDAVNEVCVFGVPDPKFGEGIKAVCALHPGMELSKEDLIAFTGSLIAGYKKPRYIEFIAELPKAGDGSIDREKIKETFS